VKVCPATVTVPQRARPVLAATAKSTLPSPEPLAPAVMVMNASLLTAVQLQPLPPVTVTLLVPPLAVKVWLAELIENGGPMTARSRGRSRPEAKTPRVFPGR